MASVIASTGNRALFRVRWQLAVLFCISIFIIITGYYFLRHLLELGISAQNVHPALTKTIEQFFTTLPVFHFLTLLIVIIGSYLLANEMLKPIEAIYLHQKRFIADASHELFTPLSIMKTNSEVALMEVSQEDYNPKEAVEALQSNIEEIDRMSNIIRNLKKLSNAEGNGSLTFTKINIAEITAKIVKDLAGLAAKKRIVIRIKKPASAIVWGNETALEEVVTNLLKNAVSYTPRGGKIDIFIRNRGSHKIEWCIKDTGVGIAKEDLAHIFDPFYRGKSSSVHADQKSSHQAAGYNGSGLGLSIVKEIIDKHRGSIHIKSAPGAGTAITLNFATG